MQQVAITPKRALAAGRDAMPAARREIDQGAAVVVNKLFRELQAIFPAWKQAWPDDAALAAAKRSWTKAFMAAGITQLEQIRFGLAMARTSGGDFMPSSGKFVKWCTPTPEMLGLPDCEKAFREALRMAHPAMGARIDDPEAWSHQAVRHAALEAGLYSLGRLQMDPARKLFERAYELTCKMVLAGEPLREIPKALPAKCSAPADSHKARAALAAMRSALAGEGRV